MNLVIEGMERPEIGEYKVFVFDDPIVHTRRIMIDRHYTDNCGRKVGNYSLYDFYNVYEDDEKR